MTGSASHSEECNKAQCAARRRARRQAYRRRCDIWIACISAVLSVALILLVVLLMSFIEFQSRLANSRSDIRASELVNRLLESYENQDALETYRELAAEFAAKRQEANALVAERGYRIDRICSLFCPALRMVDAAADPAESAAETGRARGRVDQCRFFLAKIPFEGTASAAGRVLRLPPPLATDQLRSAENRSLRSLGETIMANFLTAVGNQNDGIVAYGPRLQDQLLRIAEANRHLAVELKPELQRLEHESAFQCQRVEARGAGRDTSFCSSEWRGRSVTESFAEYDGADLCGRPARENPREAAPCPQCAGNQPPATPAGSGEGTDPSAIAGGQIVQSTGRAVEDTELSWEFLTHFRLYYDLTGGIAQRLILSPPDYLAQWLLLFGGALGAMLNILFKHLAPGRSNRWTDLVVEPVQGMACAIIVFILFRSGFVVISGQNESNDTATLSSYFVAFIAIGAGMLSEQALSPSGTPPRRCSGGSS
ncbi:MAG: hypothetical protein K0S00_1428 [Xanthobacteraceae bacterium]|jgi:hypothetical protein|nr:hypothetical protein [Xanthobacteraceae bacterium]